MTNAASDDQCWTVEEDEKFAEFMDRFGMDIETIVLMMAHNGYHRSNEEIEKRYVHHLLKERDSMMMMTMAMMEEEQEQEEEQEEEQTIGKRKSRMDKMDDQPHNNNNKRRRISTKRLHRDCTENEYELNDDDDDDNKDREEEEEEEEEKRSRGRMIIVEQDHEEEENDDDIGSIRMRVEYRSSCRTTRRDVDVAFDISFADLLTQLYIPGIYQHDHLILFEYHENLSSLIVCLSETEWAIAKKKYHANRKLFTDEEWPCVVNIL